MNHVSILEALLNIGRGHQQLLSQAITGAYDERRELFDRKAAEMNAAGQTGDSAVAGIKERASDAASEVASAVHQAKWIVAKHTAPKPRGWPKGKKRKPRAAKAATKRKVKAKK